MKSMIKLLANLKPSYRPYIRVIYTLLAYENALDEICSGIRKYPEVVSEKVIVDSILVVEDDVVKRGKPIYVKVEEE